MRHVIISLMFVLTLCLSGAAMAVPPAGKSVVLHCGCNATGDGMQYSAIDISSKSKGHDAHVVGTIDSCFDGVDTYTDFVRSGDDCQISGPDLGEPIDACSEFQTPPLAGDTCGTEVVTP